MISDIIEQILVAESFRIIKDSYCRSNTVGEVHYAMPGFSSRITNAAIQVHKDYSKK
jgi:hypothetical protein